ncbi:MAG TPA: glycosyltransferase family 2 protein [Bacteroides sp.]|nr:glycosyltransferase family 2 protein [Bacteroides sp.]
MASIKSSIVIPAYNEKDVIGGFLERIEEAGLHHRYEILVVDDGSDDGTDEIIGQYPVRLIRHRVNKGYGAALKTGIRSATGERVIIMDSDGQHDPRYVDAIHEMLDEHDLVIGERSAASRQRKRRKAGKRLVRWIGEFLVEQKLPDYNSGYRGFKKEIIAGMLHMMPNGFSFSTTSTLAFLKEGYDVGTLEIDVSEREGRKSNVKAVRDGSKTILLLFRIIMLFNPLKVFFPASVISFLAGVGFGIAGYIFYGRFSNGAIVLTILGMFLFFIGLVADQIAIMNRRTP